MNNTKSTGSKPVNPNPTVSNPAEPAPAAASVDQTSKDSFPASDPPASHLPDVPPANADDKWRAAKEHAQQSDRSSGGPESTQDTPGRAEKSSSRQQTHAGQGTQSGAPALDQNVNRSVPANAGAESLSRRDLPPQAAEQASRSLADKGGGQTIPTPTPETVKSHKRR